MDKDERIKELEYENAKLKDELQTTKEHLKKYTAPSYKKEYYEKNKDIINERNKKLYLCRTSNQAVLTNCYKQNIHKV